MSDVFKLLMFGAVMVMLTACSSPSSSQIGQYYTNVSTVSTSFDSNISSSRANTSYYSQEFYARNF
jgi:outer membrane lipoprotein-sorting protein